MRGQRRRIRRAIVVNRLDPVLPRAAPTLSANLDASSDLLTPVLLQERV
jgi:hypothetical protein